METQNGDAIWMLAGVSDQVCRSEFSVGDLVKIDPDQDIVDGWRLAEPVMALSSYVQGRGLGVYVWTVEFVLCNLAGDSFVFVSTEFHRAWMLSDALVMVDKE